MSELFIVVLNMSLSASFVAIAVMLLRLVLRRTPKVFSYVLWAIVFFRLICPFSFESTLSLLAVKPDAVPQDIVYAQNPAIESGVGFMDNAVNGAIRNSLPPVRPESSVNPMGIIIDICADIWMLGILVLVGYGIFSYLRLQRRLADATLAEGNIYETDRISTPFVMGFLRPRIYLPFGLATEERDYILQHEQTHIRRRDYLIKPLGFLALTLHWFNPLVWLSYRLMCRDMEMSCDERVIGQYGEDIRAKYSGSLLSLSMKQSGLLVPLAFGEPDAKSRIKNVLNYKKPAFWISVVAVIVLVVAGFCLLANPAENNVYVNRYPEDARTSFMNKAHDDIQIKDGSGNDISYIAIDLWYAANEVYNVDDVVMFKFGEYDVSLAEYPGPQSNELINYYNVVENVFTENGIAQLEQTAIGGNAPLIRKINGKVYRMGAWKTGYSYGYAMESMQTKEIAGERITITAQYEIHPGYVVAFGDTDYVPEYDYVDFTIAKVGGRWLVDDYIYPEAYQDYQGLTKEEYEDLQAQKARYEAMTDEQKQVAREGGTVGCKKFVHLWWEESIDNNFIDNVGSDRFSEWISKNRDSDNCLTIYSFADEFGLDLNTLKTIITENHLEEFYPLDMLEARYYYFNPEAQTDDAEQESPQTEAVLYADAVTQANEDKTEILAALQDMTRRYRNGTVVNNELEPRFDTLPEGIVMRDFASVDDFIIEPGNEMFPVRVTLEMNASFIANFYLSHMGPRAEEITNGLTKEDGYVWAVSAVGIYQNEEPEYDFFTVPEMTAEQQEYHDEYLRKLLYSSLLMRDWSPQDYSALLDHTGSAFASYLILAFEDITGSEEMQRLFNEYNGDFPTKVIEDVLLKSFPFSINQLHEILSYHYRADTNTYYYEGGRGGGPIEAAVVGIRTQGNFVYLDYEFYNGFSGLDGLPETYLYKTPGVLTLQRKADGRYLYYAVDVGEQEEAPLKTQAG